MVGRIYVAGMSRTYTGRMSNRRLDPDLVRCSDGRVSAVVRQDFEMGLCLSSLSLSFVGLMMK
jgi:hypothetical protein